MQSEIAIEEVRAKDNRLTGLDAFNGKCQAKIAGLEPFIEVVWQNVQNVLRVNVMPSRKKKFFSTTYEKLQKILPFRNENVS